MNELLKLKQVLGEHRERIPHSKKYPKSFWEEVLPLAQRIGAKRVAKELGISLGYLRTKLRKNAPSDGEKCDFVQIPPAAIPVSQGRVTLEFPGGLILRIES